MHGSEHGCDAVQERIWVPAVLASAAKCSARHGLPPVGRVARMWPRPQLSLVTKVDASTASATKGALRSPFESVVSTRAVSRTCGESPQERRRQAKAKAKTKAGVRAKAKTIKSKVKAKAKPKPKEEVMPRLREKARTGLHDKEPKSIL